MCCVKKSVCLDCKLRGGAIYIVWIKLVSETKVNCEKRSFEGLLCTRNVSQSEKNVRDALLSYQITFNSLHWFQGVGPNK